MTARQGEEGFHNLPFGASLRTSALCQSSDSYKALCIAKCALFVIPGTGRVWKTEINKWW